MARASKRPPRADAAIAGALSERFRSEEIYAYSYERSTWTTWETRHDFDATERNGSYRCCCAPMCPHGPRDWERADLVAWLGLDVPPVRKLTRAQLVAALRAVDGLPVAAVELLDAAA